MNRMKIEELKNLNYTEKLNRTSSDFTLIVNVQSNTLPFQNVFCKPYRNQQISIYGI